MAFVGSIDVMDYLGGLKKALPLADVFIPVPFAATALGVEQTTVRAYIRSGQLEALNVMSEYDEKWPGVSARSLLKEMATREKVIDDLVAPATQLLMELAGQLVEYGVFMTKLGLSAANPHHRSLIARVLGRVSEQSKDEYGILLSAQVVRKNNHLPSDPFFDLAVHLKAMRPESDKSAFLLRQLKKIKELAAAGWPKA